MQSEVANAVLRGCLWPWWPQLAIGQSAPNTQLAAFGSPSDKAA